MVNIEKSIHDDGFDNFGSNYKIARHLNSNKISKTNILIENILISIGEIFKKIKK